ncbi:MAG TPA: hypothetical protein VGQ59_20320 [Cyclobacteriaceae bacterium]|jgi:hypothetical protein|nr:hypothetical protein [Cyclobacteriaceae bacterium]
MSLADWIGFIGVSILLLAFLLNLLKKISQDSHTYILLNLIGAGLACVASILIEYVPFIILEGAWTLVSLVSWIRLIISGKNSD